MTSAIRSFTTRTLCGLVAATALAAGAPTAAFADHRDDRGWRSERYHGYQRGRDHRWDRGDYRRYAYRPVVRVYRHGPSCSHRPVYRYGYRPVHPYFYGHGVFLGR